MEPTNFNIDYQGAVTDITDEVRTKVSRSFEKLVRGHKDLQGATIALNSEGGNSSTTEFRVRINLLCRGGNIVAVEHGATITTAFVSALDNVERQVRSMREKRRTARKKV